VGIGSLMGTLLVGLLENCSRGYPIAMMGDKDFQEKSSAHLSRPGRE
jgi:hypothetical protein